LYFLDIWIENGSTREEFVRKARTCIRNSHNRVYRRKHLKRLKHVAESSGDDKEDFPDVKIENLFVDNDDIQEEYLESDENDE
jgi:hypothetical protein